MKESQKMVEAVGIEPTAEPLSDKDLQQSIDEKYGPQAPSRGDLTPDLDQVVAAWPALPQHIKAAVVTLVQAAGVQP